MTPEEIHNKYALSTVFASMNATIDVSKRNVAMTGLFVLYEATITRNDQQHVVSFLESSREFTQLELRNRALHIIREDCDHLDGCTQSYQYKEWAAHDPFGRDSETFQEMINRYRQYERVFAEDLPLFLYSTFDI